MFGKVDYLSFAQLEYRPEDLDKAGPWDVFVSAYDETDRVRDPFGIIRADHKHWIVHEEYGFAAAAVPAGATKLPSTFNPPAIVQFAKQMVPYLKNGRLCIDSTGFIRPHLLVLFRVLRDEGIRSFDVLYSDPVRYVADENTAFTVGPVERVGQVPGYEGIHRPSGGSDDLLVIGAGYDYEQIMRACEYKRRSRKILLTGLPSLQPHMYQESALRINYADEWVGKIPPDQKIYASANNPFSVAQALHDLITQERQKSLALGNPLGNLYLCPIGPKPHMIGFAVCYLRELDGTNASIIYPFAKGYSPATTQGLRRTWRYCIEL